MVIRLHNLSRWEKVPAGSMLKLEGDHERRIRLEVNTPAETRIDLVLGEDKYRFLGMVKGLETLEFLAPATVHLMFSGPDEVWISTIDGEKLAYERPSEMAAFVRPFERKARNSELERMMWKMEQNARRRESMLLAEVNALRDSINSNVETGEVEDELPFNEPSEPSVDPGTDPVVAGASPVEPALGAKSSKAGKDNGASA